MPRLQNVERTSVVTVTVTMLVLVDRVDRRFHAECVKHPNICLKFVPEPEVGSKKEVVSYGTGEN